MEKFKVGQAPWEVIDLNSSESPGTFKVGQAPWELKPEEEKGILSKTIELAGDVLSPVSTAIDYTYAPLRQAAMAPRRLAEGNVVEAITSPFAQLFSPPSSAPSSEDVLKAYGVPESKQVSPIIQSNPMMGSSYENNPAESDQENVTIHPAKSGAVLTDMLAGGEGVNMLMKGAGKVASVAQKGASELGNLYKPSAEIVKASHAIGAEATPGMLAGEGSFLERLESTLAKSPSVWGRGINKKQMNAVEAISKATDKALEGGSSLTPFQLGEKIKSGMAGKVSERLDPISAVYDEVKNHTKLIPVSEKSISAITRNIQKIPSYRLTEGSGAPAKYVDMLSRAKTADDVKTITSLLGKDIGSVTGAERQVLIEMKEKLRNLETNSIMRAAIDVAKSSGGKMQGRTGTAVGSELVGDLKNARKGYAELTSDLKDVSLDARLGKPQGSGDFLNRVEGIPSEKIQDKFFNPENLRQIQKISEVFPDEFQLLRQGKIADIASASQGRSGVNTNAFLREVNKLNPEVKNILFKDSSILKNIETTQLSIPRNFNPSGTASEGSWHSAIGANLTDIPNYLLYKGIPMASNMAKKVPVAQIAEAASVSPAGYGASVVNLVDRMSRQQSQIPMPKAAEKQAADQAKVQEFIMKSSQAGMTPQDQERMIKKDKTISNTEKAKARNQIRGG